ncbi:MAG: hypothetical protein ACLSHU_12510 [Oscillospiraceae bacterium]
MYSYQGPYPGDWRPPTRSRPHVTAQWEPETPGWYQAGALTGEGTACCAGAKDYEHVYPSEYVLVLLGQDQKALPDISCTVQELWALEDERQSSATWSRMDSLESVPFPMAR